MCLYFFAYIWIKFAKCYIGANDAGFSCAWNQSSEKFAVASQDGFVSVWDIRSPEKLCLLSSKQVKKTAMRLVSKH